MGSAGPGELSCAGASAKTPKVAHRSGCIESRSIGEGSARETEEFRIEYSLVNVRFPEPCLATCCFGRAPAGFEFTALGGIASTALGPHGSCHGKHLR